MVQLCHKIKIKQNILLVSSRISLKCFFFLIYRNSGDTGYVPELFQSIRDLYSPFSLAAIPIGTYEPQSMLKSIHMNPAQAVKAHVDLGSPRLSVGIHWGTFMKSNEPYLSPIQQLSELAQDGQFITTLFGETLFIE
jgi:N-acyl-phosphatidylethanolamine-hydrolysing phospholipase D